MIRKSHWRAHPSADWRAWVAVYLKGAFMGAADVVPGVSGGTIALITGIYDRLVAAITALDPRVLAHAKHVNSAEGRAEFRAALVEMDLPFLLVLGAGIATSVLALSTVMHRAITSPTLAPPTFAFFFGLIGASAVVLYRYVSVGTPGRVAAGVGGFGLAWVVSGATADSAATAPPLLVVFLAGAIAITAMILPGISGAFILLVLNLYQYMSDIPGRFVGALLAVAEGNGVGNLAGPGIPLITFLAGAALGLVSVAHVVRWALDRYRPATLTFLVALMVGALRAPAREISEHVVVWTPGIAATVGLAGLVGAVLVLGLDRYTDDFEY